MQNVFLQIHSMEAFCKHFPYSVFTFKRFKQTAESQNSRVENLLTMMGIGERLIDETMIIIFTNLQI